MTHTSISAEAVQAAFRKFTDSLSPELKQRMNGRLERGLEIVLSGGVTRYDYSERKGFVRRYKVVSSDPANPPYQVDLVARSCTCPDYFKGHFCKHRVAAQVFEMAETNISPGQTQVTPPSLPTQEPAAQDHTIIWACVRLNEKTIGVEVVGIEDDLVRVQALPLVKEGGKLEPQFPFPNGSFSHLVPANELVHVRIFRNA